MVLRRIRESSMIGPSLVMVAGTGSAQALPILFTPVLSRMFTPDDFGMFGLFTAFIGFASVAVGLSFPLAIVSSISIRLSAQLAILSLILSLPSAVSLVILFSVLRSHAVFGFGNVPATGALWILLSLLAIGAFTTLRYWQILNGSYGIVARSTVGQSVGRVTSQVVAGVIAAGGLGLMVSEVIGRATGVIQLMRVSLREIRTQAAKTSIGEYVSIFRDFWKFPILSTPSSMINSLSQALPVPLLASAYSLSVSGQFAMSYRVLALPIAVVSAAVADVFHGQLAKAAAKDMADARKLFFRVAVVLFSVGIVPSIILMVWGEELFQFVLGSQWVVAGAIASGIMPWLLASFVVSPLSRVVLVFRGQELKLVYDILAAISVVSCIRYGSAQGWTVEQTSALLGISQGLVYLVYFALLWRIMVREGHEGMREPNS